MRFSVITVTFNAQETIEKTIKSVISQDYYDIEYILIDGQSSDDTMQIVEKYKEYIDVCISEPDNGIYDAMNKGIKMATGDVIAFMNSGDWYEKNIFSKVEKVFLLNNTEIVCGRVRKITDGKANGFIGYDNIVNPDDLHKGNIYCHQGLFIKQNVFEKIGLYDVSYRILADYDWNLRAYNYGYSFYCIDDIIANYLDGGISAVSMLNPIEYYEISIKNLNEKYEYLNEIEDIYRVRKENKGTELMIAQKKIFDEFLPQDNELYIWGSGFNGLLCRDLYLSAGYKILGFIDSNPKAEKIDEYPIYRGDKFLETNNKNVTIVITPRAYDDEIKAQLINKGFSQERLIMFCELLTKAGDYYSLNMKK